VADKIVNKTMLTQVMQTWKLLWVLKTKDDVTFFSRRIESRMTARPVFCPWVNDDVRLMK
jgi:hypothetical protein